MSELYIERDCCFEHKGRKFCSGGAIVTPDVIVAYPAKDGVLTDWHGEEIGRWKNVASWRPSSSSWIGSIMYQIEARVDGVLYTGRGFGVGMIYRGKRKARGK